MGATVPDARYIQIGYGNAVSGVLGIEELQMIPPSEEANLNSTKVVGDLTLRCNGKFTTDTKTWCWIKVPNMDKYLNIQVFKNTNEEMNGLLDQILSTFKFTDLGSSSVTEEKQKIELAAKMAFVKKTGQEPTTKYGLSDESFKAIDDWAFGIITVAPVNEGAGPGANYFIARKINNVWEAKIEYTDEFRDWLKISPDGLVSTDLKQFLQ